MIRIYNTRSFDTVFFMRPLCLAMAAALSVGTMPGVSLAQRGGGPRSGAFGCGRAAGEYAFGPSMSNLHLGVGVKNIFDRRYFTRSTDNNDGIYVGQPRTYYVQASVDF